jgi:hypothetical protein
VQLPAFEEVCNGTDGGYFPFTIANPPAMAIETVVTPGLTPYLAHPVIITADSNASVNASYFAGESVSCPPNCGGSVVPLTSLSGLYYFRPCNQFTSGDVCLSPPPNAVCGYGVGGDDCKRCPVGAVCPGGNRLWPRKGMVSSDHRGSSLGTRVFTSGFGGNVSPCQGTGRSTSGRIHLY